MTTRTCKGCGVEKPLTDYFVTCKIKDQRRHSCKACERQRNVARASTQAAEHRSKIARYGISVEDFEALWEAQGGACAICKTPNEALTRRLHIDHCHTTKEVRGLLCTNCNAGLGQFKDNPTLLQNALSYLNKS